MRPHQARGDDPDVGRRHGDRRGASASATNPSVGGLLLPLVGTPEWNLPVWEPLWAAIQETGIPAVMHQGTGHDMIFYRGWGSPDRQPAHDAVDGAARRRAAELQRRARAPPRPARGDGRGERGMDGVDDVDARRVLPRAPAERLDEADPGRAPEPLPPAPGARHVPGRSRSRSTTSRSPAPTACSGATTTRTPRARTPTRTRSSTGCSPTSATTTRTPSCSTNAARTLRLPGRASREPVRVSVRPTTPRRAAATSRSNGRSPRPGRGPRNAPALLIDAALDLVAERKSLEFTVQEVVDRTKLSLHAFYQLFESKDALVEAVLEESLERGVMELRRRVDEAEPPDRPAPRLRRRLLRARDREPASGPRLRARRSPSSRCTSTSPRRPRPGTRTARCGSWPTSCCAPRSTTGRSAPTSIPTSSPPSSWPRSAPSPRSPSPAPVPPGPTGEQVWQLVADGVRPLPRG